MGNKMKAKDMNRLNKTDVFKSIVLFMLLYVCKVWQRHKKATVVFGLLFFLLFYSAAVSEKALGNFFSRPCEKHVCFVSEKSQNNEKQNVQ